MGARPRELGILWDTIKKIPIRYKKDFTRNSRSNILPSDLKHFGKEWRADLTVISYE
jgi:hypothetical protein